jgi:Vps23 core domain
MNLVAEDNAIEDTIYHLHRALNAGRIDLDKFLRVCGFFSASDDSQQPVASDDPSVGRRTVYETCFGRKDRFFYPNGCLEVVQATFYRIPLLHYSTTSFTITLLISCSQENQDRNVQCSFSLPYLRAT